MSWRFYCLCSLQSGLFSPRCSLLLKVEPPNCAHLIKNEQKTLCKISIKYDTFTIFQQPVKDKERYILGVNYCIEGCEFEASKWVWKLSAISTLSCRPVLATCSLEFDFFLKISNIRVEMTVFINRHFIWNPLEFVASVLAHDVEEIRKIKNSAKFALKVTRGNGWRKWVVVTFLPSLVCILRWPQKPVWWNNIVCWTRSRAQAYKTVLWHPTL